jgi:tripartite-type tricarboxylate transporter receptor subunit TctC
MHRRHFLQAGAALGSLAAVPAAFAQQAGTMFVWSGFPPGGLGDQVGRPLIDLLRGKLAPNIVYDSKPGAGGRIAAEHVKRAAPDGNHLLQTPSSIMVLQPHVFRKMPYDTLADFVPIAPLCSYTTVFTAGPGLPAEVRTLADYLKWAKANPTQANYGVPAAGSTTHLAGMLLARQTGTDLRAVPYKGGAPLLNDLLGGQVPLTINVVSEVLPHIRAGKLRALSVTAPTRWKALPDVPTMAELGFRDASFIDWLGWYGPAGIPAARVQALNAAVSEGMATPAMQENLARNGLEPMRLAPDRFAELVRKDHAYWANVVKVTGFKPDD